MQAILFSLNTPVYRSHCGENEFDKNCAIYFIIVFIVTFPTNVTIIITICINLIMIIYNSSSVCLFSKLSYLQEFTELSKTPVVLRPTI